MRILSRLSVLGMLLSVSALASAHTSATSSTPKSGSVLTQSPPSVEIKFKDAVRITSVVLAHEGKADRKLTSSPQTSATTFAIDSPNLEPGRNEIRWIALSKDGHVIKGTIELTLKAADTAPAH